MHRQTAIKALGALAQATRLDAFRTLVQAGPAGLAAGDLAARLGTSPPALSFHLKGLTHAGLARARQQGRYVIYTADFDAMQSLLDYLTENCCQGGTCAASPPQRSSRRHP